jgi:3-methyl-2-oxobutanoate hydroxymethyltransferase
MTYKKPLTTIQIQQMKAKRAPITMLTAYDATFAKLIDEAGAEMILVGDSLGMVIQGLDNTIPVTLDEMIYHARAVCRGVQHAHVVCDMPFMAYQGDALEAMKNAGRILKESGAQSVKLEGGAHVAPTIERLVSAGIPVMGHLGLTPQAVHAMGGFRVQGKDPQAAQKIVDDALILERAGVYALVLEGIPAELARVITQSLRIPTIGIGAGVDCDGQVLVIYDLLGMNPDFKPKFVKRYLNLGQLIPEAVREFKQEINDRSFPSEAHSFHAKMPLFAPHSVQSSASEEEDSIGLYGVPVELG